VTETHKQETQPTEQELLARRAAFLTIPAL